MDKTEITTDINRNRHPKITHMMSTHRATKHHSVMGLLNIEAGSPGHS